AGVAGILVAGGTGVAVAQIALPDTPTEVPGDLTDVTDVTVPPVTVPDVADDTEVPEDDFGAQVSADARGESDGVPGVDGGQISEQARARAEAGENETDVEVEVDDENEVGDEPRDNFGAQVSADARGESDGVPGVDGRQISEQARAQGQARAEAGGDDDDVEVEVDGEADVTAGAQGRGNSSR
ncbi:MAG: hypothetical protein ACR2K0_02100, partial [Acidimicrobiales bacterium]